MYVNVSSFSAVIAQAPVAAMGSDGQVTMKAQYVKE